MEIAFDSEKYINAQREKIIEQVQKYGKLYFELGGKLLDDHHASRILPGFKPDTKMQIISGLKDISELIICVNSENIQNGRIRSDYNTLYTEDCLKLISQYRDMGFNVSGVVLTLFKEQEKAVAFQHQLEAMGENVYLSRFAKNYPQDENAALEAFKASDYIRTTKPLVIMTSSGSASGKLSASLGQIYNEYLRGHRVGYAKYDIFPVWNLPINHPINLAFKAATADSNDQILVDTYYLEKYNKVVSNYNRDLNVFPIIRKVLTLANGGVEPYSTPTEMVLNTMKDSILNEELVSKMCKEEVCRRFLTYQKQQVRGQCDKHSSERVKQIMDENGITMDDLKVVGIAKEIFKKNPNKNLGVLELRDGTVIEVEKVNEIELCVSMLLAFLKNYGLDFEVDNSIDVPYIIDFLNEFGLVNDLYNSLYNCNMHTSYLVSKEDEKGVKQFGVNLTCEPVGLKQPLEKGSGERKFE